MSRTFLTGILATAALVAGGLATAPSADAAGTPSLDATVQQVAVDSPGDRRRMNVTSYFDVAARCCRPRRPRRGCSRAPGCG